MSGGRFFNSLGYGQGAPNPQPNNLNNNNQNAFLGNGNMMNSPMQGRNNNVQSPTGASVPFDPMNPMNPVGPSNSTNPMNPMNPVSPSSAMNPMNPMNTVGPSNSMNPMNPVGGSGPMIDGNPMNSVTVSNQMNNGNMMQGMNPTNNSMSNNQVNNGNSMNGQNPMNSINQNPMNYGNTVGMQNPMNNGNSMQNMNPMQDSMMNASQPQGNPMTSFSQMNNMNSMNSIANTSSMGNVNPMNNNQKPMNGNGLFMNSEMGAAQSFGVLHQDPNPSVTSVNNQNSNPMMNPQTGASQGFLGIQQSSMNEGNNQNNNQQQMIMMSSNNDGPSFNNSLNGISPLNTSGLDNKMSNTNIEMKPKLKLDVKKLFIIGIVVLLVIGFVLWLFCYDSVTCTKEDKFQGVPVITKTKADFWFGKMNKITAEVIFDISVLSGKNKEKFVEEYKNLEEAGTSVDINDDTIVLKRVNRPGDVQGGADEFKKENKGDGFVCK